MTHKTITLEEENKIKDSLTKQYGDEGEDWDGIIVRVKGQEKFYAVKCPESSVWFEYKNKVQLYLTRLNAQANQTGKQVAPPQGLDGVQMNFVADCLIDDVEGVVSNREEFLSDSKIKVLLVDKLASLLTALAESGIRELKKI